LAERQDGERRRRLLDWKRRRTTEVESGGKGPSYACITQIHRSCT